MGPCCGAWQPSPCKWLILSKDNDNFNIKDKFMEHENASQRTTLEGVGVFS
jgi:hypothetical protein